MNEITTELLLERHCKYTSWKV